MTVATAMAISYTTDSHGGHIEPKAFRPKSLGEAKRLIADTFDKQGPDGWDDHNRRKYLEMKGVEPKDVSELSVEECRIILVGMSKSQMIIFREDPES